MLQTRAELPFFWETSALAPQTLSRLGEAQPPIEAPPLLRVSWVQAGRRRAAQVSRVCREGSLATEN